VAVVYLSDSKNEVYTWLTKCLLVPLDHHQHHVDITRIISPFHCHVHSRQIKLFSLEKPDESLAPIKGPMADHQQK